MSEAVLEKQGHGVGGDDLCLPVTRGMLVGKWPEFAHVGVLSISIVCFEEESFPLTPFDLGMTRLCSRTSTLSTLESVCALEG